MVIRMLQDVISAQDTLFDFSAGNHQREVVRLITAGKSHRMRHLMKVAGDEEWRVPRAIRVSDEVLRLDPETELAPAIDAFMLNCLFF